MVNRFSLLAKFVGLFHNVNILKTLYLKLDSTNRRRTTYCGNIAEKI